MPNIMQGPQESSFLRWQELLVSEHPNVPQPATPLWWQIDLPVADNLARVGRAVSGQPHDVTVDEASILTPSNWWFTKAIERLTEQGWEHVNSAQDVVYTNPFGTRYTVEYAFLQDPTMPRPFRIEVMQIVNGVSPLHDALLWARSANADITQYALPVPHLSYKPETGSTTREFAREVDALKADGYIHAQTCQSTYGVFGYYLHQDATKQVYLKPRVNLRDGDGAIGDSRQLP